MWTIAKFVLLFTLFGHGISSPIFESCLDFPYVKSEGIVDWDLTYEKYAFQKCVYRFIDENAPAQIVQYQINDCIFKWVQRVRSCLKYCELKDEINCTPEFEDLWENGHKLENIGLLYRTK